MRRERDQLLEISNDLKGQVSSLQKSKEQAKKKEQEVVRASINKKVEPSENLQESKLDRLRLEVEQMRELVNKFKFNDGEQQQDSKENS